MLTAVAIKAAKGRDKQYKLGDSGGLYLLVTPAGRRCWRMNYRFLGKQKTLSFGAWPDVGLAGARAKRDEARQLLATGRAIGRASCRERVCQYVLISVVAVSLKKKLVDNVIEVKS